MFIVYSDVFRLTQVIFRLELYLFAMSLCSFWDPRRLHVFYIDVMYCITIEDCNTCHCYGIVFIGSIHTTNKYIYSNQLQYHNNNIVTTSNCNTVDNIYVKNM